MSEVTAAIVRDGKVIEHVALDAGLPPHGKSGFTWIEVLDPVDGDFDFLQKRFGLHSLAVDDAMRPAPAPKLDLYGEQIFVVLNVARLESDVINYGEVNAFLSADHIITVRRSADSARAHDHEKFLNGPKNMGVSPDFILHSIVESVVSGYFPIVQAIEDHVLAVEQHLEEAFLDRNEITRLLRLRREVIRFQHVLTRMSDVCGTLANLDLPGIGAAAKPYFRDVHDHLLRLDAMVGGLVDVILTVFETSGLLEQQREGKITRQLAAWAAILGVPAAIASIYGMAFPSLPELHAAYGYAIVIAMALLCLGLYRRFKKLRWL
jgi:magnesium transporter